MKKMKINLKKMMAILAVGGVTMSYTGIHVGEYSKTEKYMAGVKRNEIYYEDNNEIKLKGVIEIPIYRYNIIVIDKENFYKNEKQLIKKIK